MAHNLADGFILQHDPINVEPPMIKTLTVLLSVRVNKNSSKESSSSKDSNLILKNKIGKMPGRGVKLVAQTKYIVENVRAFF